MKKMILAVAVVLCAALSSCTDTERCFTLTTEINVLGTTTKSEAVVWGTRDDIEAAKENIRAAQEKLGIDKNSIKISAVANGKSKDECK